MEYVILGWPDEGPTLRLDYREFSYAGKFVMSNTGKAVAREARPEGGPRVDERRAERTVSEDGGEVVAAVAFNEDRTDDGTVWLRYITVRRDRRGDGIGPRLARFAVKEIRARGYDQVKIAVNNPFAYHALYKAGFGYTGERTGLAELVLSVPGHRSTSAYRDGLDDYRDRDGLSPEERAFLAAKRDAEPPDRIAVP